MPRNWPDPRITEKPVTRLEIVIFGGLVGIGVVSGIALAIRLIW